MNDIQNSLKEKYNSNNIFAKIISGILETEKLFEDDILIIIKDINPKAKIHLLAIPKGDYIDFVDFSKNAAPEVFHHYFTKIRQYAKNNDINHYKLLTNNGKESGQEIFHFHTHILSN